VKHWRNLAQKPRQMTNKLSANQKRALDALLNTASVAAAARHCGLSERTIWRYLSDDTFKSELRERQDKTIAATTAALVGLSGKAVEALRDLLQDALTPPSVKARVALGWLREKREAVELADLARRVGDLERALEGGRDEHIDQTS
jgi:AcrR family transcriptional regulator